MLSIGNMKLFSKVNGSLRATSVINNSDSVVFDLANATLTATYLDVPVYIISNDIITSFDYAIQFNLSKLTYSATIDLLSSDPSFMSSAFFNPSDNYLRCTSSSQQMIPCGTHVTKIRFLLSNTCVPISSNDFSNILTILNGSQCSFRVTTLNFLKFVPVAGFKNDPLCVNTDVQFNDTSKVGSGYISAWSWDFGNTKRSTLQNNITSYTITGTNTVSLIVTAFPSCCKDTITTALTVGVIPVSAFSFSYNCKKDSMFFTNNSTVSSGTITSSKWYLGEPGFFSNLKNPSHRFSLSGFYKVKLTSTTNASCSSSTIILVPFRPSDINHDGKTNIDDFLILAPAYGTECD